MWKNDKYLMLDKNTHLMSEVVSETPHTSLGEVGVPGPSWLFVQATKRESRPIFREHACHTTGVTPDLGKVLKSA